MFKFKRHNNKLYNTLLILSRNIFFYTNIGLKDSLETRIYLMFIHFSILMIIHKKKGSKLDQNSYDYFFHNIEYNLRESGLGDVTVNKKMKEFNKILYDILLKFDLSKTNDKKIVVNTTLVKKYFSDLNTKKHTNLTLFIDYFGRFYDFCFELPLNNMLEEAINFKY